MTYGQRLVGLSFNPSNDPKVQKLKELYAEIIDLIVESGEGRAAVGQNIHNFAVTEAMTAQMWAVKAVTWKD